MAEIKHATDANFEELVLKAERPVVVDFWAAWCGPCKMVAPEMEKLAAKYDGAVDVVKVDVDANPRLSQAFNIMSIPTIAFFKPGAQPQGVVGLPPARAARAAVRPRPSSRPSRRTDRRATRATRTGPGLLTGAVACPGRIGRPDRPTRGRAGEQPAARRAAAANHARARSTAWPSSSTGRKVTHSGPRVAGRVGRASGGRSHGGSSRNDAAPPSSTANGRAPDDQVTTPSAPSLGAELGFEGRVVEDVAQRHRAPAPASTAARSGRCSS